MKSFLRCVVMTIPVCLLLISCASTKLTDVWTDEAYHGSPFSTVLVIGVSDQQRVKRSFEDKFVNQLKKIGIEAIASSAVISSNKKLEKKDIVSAVEKSGVDAVLITHLLGVDKEKKYHPPSSTYYHRSAPYYGGYYRYYGNVYSYVNSPAYYTNHVTVLLETNMYAVDTKKLIWSGKSETWNPESDSEVIDSVIKLVIKNLQKDKLIPSK